VAVIADDPLARGALERLLGEREDVSVVASVSDADVALWDGGVDAERVPQRIRALAVTTVALVTDGFAAAGVLAAGLAGAVARDADADRLAAALVAASQGIVVLDADYLADVLPARPEPSADLAEPLTPREREVLELVAAGLSNRRIAERLGISEHTAKFHLNGILAKLGAATRTEAVVLAARHGLLML
jgi:DNA-binding NarL/FixJ family response regulator